MKFSKYKYKIHFLNKEGPKLESYAGIVMFRMMSFVNAFKNRKLLFLTCYPYIELSFKAPLEVNKILSRNIGCKIYCFYEIQIF